MKITDVTLTLFKWEGPSIGIAEKTLRATQAAQAKLGC